MLKRWHRYSADRLYREASRGKARFIFLRGVVGWGLPMFIVMSFVYPELAGLAGDSHNISSLLRGLVVWGIGGALFGWWLWFFAVRKYGLTRRAGENKVVDEQ